jgi:hypothetical protein
VYPSHCTDVGHHGVTWPTRAGWKQLTMGICRSGKSASHAVSEKVAARKRGLGRRALAGLWACGLLDPFPVRMVGLEGRLICVWVPSQ